MWAGRVLHAALSRAPRESRAQSALAQLRGILEEELESIRGAGTWKSERVITSRQGPHIHVDGAPGGNSPLLGIARPGRVSGPSQERTGESGAFGLWPHPRGSSRISS